MSEINNIKSLKELRDLKNRTRHELDIEKLEFENAKLRLSHEMDFGRIMPDLSSLLMSKVQKTFVGSILKKFGK